MIVLAIDLFQSGRLKIGNPHSMSVNLSENAEFLINDLFGLGRKLSLDDKVLGDCPVSRLNYRQFT